MYVHVVAALNLSTSYTYLVCLVPVSAGYPSPADDYLDGSLDLNQHLIKHPTVCEPCRCWRVQGTHEKRQYSFFPIDQPNISYLSNADHPRTFPM